jgi:exonuclease SbcC
MNKDLKIKYLSVKNFKIFKDYKLKIDTSNLALLDGPNGFGKTSFYDALELLFLGNVERYIKLDETTSDQRKNLGSFPLVYDGAKLEDELIIEAEFSANADIIIIRRSASKRSLNKLKRIKDAKFNLQIWKNNEPLESSNEILIFNELLGSDYRRNYSLFHYIEQEENTSILKNKGVQKQNKIDHLFDVTGYRQKITKLEEAKKSIQSLKKPIAKQELDHLVKEITSLKSESRPDNSIPVEYKRLISSVLNSWDTEILNFDSGIYSNWIGERGELELIKSFKKSSDDFLNDKYNKDVSRKLHPIPKALEPLLHFGHRLALVPIYRETIELLVSADEYLKSINLGTIKLIDTNKVFPNGLIIKALNDKIDLVLLRKSIEEIQKSLKSSSKLEKNLSEFLASRDNFIANYKAHLELRNNTGGLCPACGYDWENHEILLTQFAQQKTSFDLLISGQKSILQIQLKTFDIEFITPIKKVCEEVIESETDSIQYKREICALDQKQTSFLDKLKEEFTAHEIDLSPFYLSNFDLNSELPVPALISRIQSIFKKVNTENLHEEFDDLFKSVFNNNSKEFMALKIEAIDEKITYLQQKYTESKLVEIKKKEQIHKTKKKIYDDACRLEEELKELIKLYNTNVNQYIKSISQGIEILFHIYSGRLLQNFQNGLGVFIETDGKSISFKDTPNAEHDVIFSMSSGQLSSLIIAFSLALNHKYAKNPLLFIDDPVQTMDEINVASFIDLLRHEFKNRQIFISTHEDHISSYFRYKFGKAKLETQRINFKNNTTQE